MFIAGIMLAGAGCAQRFPWAGKWEGNRDLKVKPGQNPSVAYTIGKVELTIEADGKFVLVEGGIPKTGIATLSPDSASLKIETFADRPISRMGTAAEEMNKPVILTPQENGSITLNDPTGFDKTPIVLKKKSG